MIHPAVSGLLAAWLRPVTEAIEELAREIHRMSDTLSAEIEQLKQNVASLTSVDASAQALLKGLHDRIDAVASDMQASGVDPAELQALHDLNAQIAAQTAALAGAVAANTPAAPGGSDSVAAGGSGDAAPSGPATPAPSTPAS